MAQKSTAKNIVKYLWTINNHDTYYPKSVKQQIYVDF